jgi:hypothetical protein
VIWARAGAPRGGGRATLRVFGLPLCILSLVGCRTFDDHRHHWHDGYYGHSGYYHPRTAPVVPQTYRPVTPPVFVAPRPPPTLPPQPRYVPATPPERKYEHPHRRDDRQGHWGRDRGPPLNGGGDHKRNR